MILFESNEVIPLGITEEVRKLILERKPYRIVTQHQPSFYNEQAINKDYHDWFPNDDESYTASWESYANCKDEFPINSAVFDYILPKFEILTGIKHESYHPSTLNLVLSLTKMPANGHYRIHNDAYSCRYGFVWYLNKGWKWDWGGLLLTVNSTGCASVVRPKYNNLVFLDHSKNNNNWHCVTSVESFAQEPRMSIIGFIK